MSADISILTKCVAELNTALEEHLLWRVDTELNERSRGAAAMIRRVLTEAALDQTDSSMMAGFVAGMLSTIDLLTGADRDEVGMKSALLIYRCTIALRIIAGEDLPDDKLNLPDQLTLDGLLGIVRPETTSLDERKKTWPSWMTPRKRPDR